MFVNLDRKMEATGVIDIVMADPWIFSLAELKYGLIKKYGELKYDPRT